MLTKVKCSMLLMARCANEVVQDSKWSGCSAARLCVEGGNPQYLLSSLLLFYIFFCIS